MKLGLLMLMLASVVSSRALEGPCSVLVSLQWDDVNPDSLYQNPEQYLSFKLRDAEGTVLTADGDYHYALGPDFVLYPGSAKDRVRARAQALSEWQLRRSLFYFDLVPGTYEVEAYPNGWLMPLTTRRCDINTDDEVCVLKAPALRLRYLKMSPELVKFFGAQQQREWRVIFLPKNRSTGLIDSDGPLSVPHNLRWVVLEDEGIVEVWLVVRQPTLTYKGGWREVG